MRRVWNVVIVKCDFLQRRINSLSRLIVINAPALEKYLSDTLLYSQVFFLFFSFLCLGCLSKDLLLPYIVISILDTFSV